METSLNASFGADFDDELLNEMDKIEQNYMDEMDTKSSGNEMINNKIDTVTAGQSSVMISKEINSHTLLDVGNLPAIAGNIKKTSVKVDNVKTVGLGGLDVSVISLDSPVQESTPVLERHTRQLGSSQATVTNIRPQKTKLFDALLQSSESQDACSADLDSGQNSNYKHSLEQGKLPKDNAKVVTNEQVNTSNSDSIGDRDVNTMMEYNSEGNVA